MRRLLIIFLLAMMPLQAAWAAVCAYCPDNCISELSSSPAPDDVASDDAGPGDDGDCSRCHMGAAGLACSPISSRISPPPGRLAAADGSPIPNAGPAGRPERPNWMRAA